MRGTVEENTSMKTFESQREGTEKASQTTHSAKVGWGPR